jgi:hypothetical protein
MRKLILKYDVIHGVLKIICNKNIKHPRNFGDIKDYDVTRNDSVQSHHTIVDLSQESCDFIGLFL